MINFLIKHTAITILVFIFIFASLSFWSKKNYDDSLINEKLSINLNNRNNIIIKIEEKLDFERKMLLEKQKSFDEQVSNLNLNQESRIKTLII